MPDSYVMDVTMWADYEDGLRPFCPYNPDDGSITLGLTLLTDKPDGPVVGVFHEDGQEAVDRWCAEHRNVLVELGMIGQFEGDEPTCKER